MTYPSTQPNAHPPATSRVPATAVAALVFAAASLAIAFVEPFSLLAWFLALLATVLAVVAFANGVGRSRVVGSVALVLSVTATLVAITAMVESGQIGSGADSNADGPRILDSAHDGADADLIGTPDSPVPMDTPWGYKEDRWGSDGTEWEGQFLGIVELDVWSSDDQEAGVRCFAVIGVISPTATEEGAHVAAGADTPDIGFLIDGAAQKDSYSCVADALIDDGYDKLRQAEVAVGVDFSFYEPFAVPAHTDGDPQFVTLGDPSDSSALYFAPEIVELD